MIKDYVQLAYEISSRIGVFKNYQDLINSSQSKNYFKKISEYNSSNKARVKRIKNKKRKK